jgi:hypothetical protein
MQNFTNNNSSLGNDFSAFSFINNLNMDGSDQLQTNNNNGMDVSVINAYLQSNQGNSVNWATCNHCQQLFANNEAYNEHEATCPLRPRASAGGINPAQLQQYIQLQQNNLNLQQQFEQQQVQLNQQFQEQQAQLNHHHNQQAAFSALASMGGDMGGAPYCMPALPSATTAYQGLNALQQGIEMNEAADGMVQDQFDTLVNQLPAFNPPAAIPSKKATLSPPPESNSTDYFPLALLPEDEKWLTPLHCFVRQYCAEVFVATAADVEAPCMGKRSPVSVGQVGIRCPYCSPKNEETRASGLGFDVARSRENGVVFPSIVSRIYNATINLLQRHLRTCSFVPPAVLARYDELKASNARSGASKKYWVESALRMGLYDTPNGIWLNKDMYLQTKMNAKREIAQGDGPADASAASKEGQNVPPLVLPADKRYTTAFTFHLMAQMQPCVFTEADRLGRRRNLDVGFAGLACRHCFGGHGNGRFFPSSIKTMSDASKTLDAIYKHIGMCKKCPDDIKQGLDNLKEFHDSEKSKMPFGNQRAFFARIWGRLHDNDRSFAPAAAPTEDSKPFSLPAATMPSLSMSSINKDNAAKLEGDSPSSLQALYSQLSRNNATMKKMVNEAA